MTTATLTLIDHLKELLQHPDFEYEVELEDLQDNVVVFTFDTQRSNFDLILDDNKNTALLMEYAFVPSPDGAIDDYDVEFNQAHQIESVQQFLDTIKLNNQIKAE